MHDVHVPFEPLTVFPLLVALGIAGVVRWRRAEPARAAEHPVVAAGSGIVRRARSVRGSSRGHCTDRSCHRTGTRRRMGASSTRSCERTTCCRSFRSRSRDLISFEHDQDSRRRPRWCRGSERPRPRCDGTDHHATLALLPLVADAARPSRPPDRWRSPRWSHFFATRTRFPSDQAIIGRFPEVVDSTLIVPFIVASLRVIRGTKYAGQRPPALRDHRIDLGDPRTRSVHGAGRCVRTARRGAAKPCERHREPVSSGWASPSARQRPVP